MLRIPPTTSFASSFASQNSLSPPPTISSTAVLSLEKQTELARGALNFVRENYFGNEKNRKAAIEKAKRDDAVFINSDGETEYCNNLDVLNAIKQILTLAEDIETITLIFDNALRYGYQQELAVLMENCCADFLTSKVDAKRQALADKLKVRNVKIVIDNNNGTFWLEEIPAGSQDRRFLEATKNELNELGIPMVVGSVIGQYQERMSFEKALLLTSERVRIVLRGRDMPYVLPFLKEKFEAGIIDSNFIKKLSFSWLNVLDSLAWPSSNMQAIFKKYGIEFFLSLSRVGLEIVTVEEEIQPLILQEKITLSDLKKIDKFTQTKNMAFCEVDLACDFSSSAAIKAWIEKNS